MLAHSIASLITKGIETATFPSHLKVAKVFPIDKNGTKSDPSSYRPISILPAISKPFEKHINNIQKLSSFKRMKTFIREKMGHTT